MKLKLLDFIREHENWEELLINSPYNLRIIRKDDYILLKYKQTESDFSLDIVKECRGIILRESDYRVVCFPFVKFFNANEPNAATIDWKSARVQEKIDGSLIKIWCDDKNGVSEWHVSTNGNIDAFSSPIDNDISPYTNYGSLFMSVFGRQNFNKLNKNYTYIFELVSPYTKIVTYYPYTDIYHLRN